MTRAMLPFNIEILKLEPRTLATMKPVTSLDYYENTNGQLHEDGLFSVSIFGRVGDELRDERFSYIDLGASIFHPAIYKTLVQLKGLYQGILLGTTYARWDEAQKDFVAADELHGKTGYGFFMEHWRDIEFHRTRSPLRDIRLKLIDKYQDRAMLDKILVLPAGLRDIEVGDDGRPVVGEVNTFYRKLLAVSRTVADSHASHDSPSLNLPRQVMQQAFNDTYEFFTRMLEGKKGFVQNRWGGRRIASGTRNVISAMNGSTALLGGPRAPKYNDTIVGLYQAAIALLPISIFHLRTHYLDDIFALGDGKARLVDPKTLKGVITSVSSLAFDKWTTNEGLEKVISNYGELTTRKKAVMVDDYYMALIYRGPDGTFRVFSDIDELPKHLSRKDVHPINYTELLYLSGYQVWNTYYGFVTRYPITGTGSTYPTSIYLKTTTVGEERRELGHDWQPLGPDHVALEFPKADLDTFVDSLVLSPTRLEGLGADFDGDTCSLNMVYSRESLKSCQDYLNTKNAYVDPRGGLRASSSTFTAELVLRSMTA
jgi:hypothetical protein